MKKKIYLDFDGVVVNTIKAVVDTYNDDFRFYNNFKKVHWEDVFHWDFRELKYADREYINFLFTQPRFFKRLEFMDNAKEVLNKLKEKYEIVIVSMGITPNLRAKKNWIKKNMPYAKFVGVNYSKYYSKDHIDMSDGILFLDDNASNLLNVNAQNVVVFGDVYPWNETWEDERCFNWYDVNNLINKLENCKNV